MLVPYLAIVRGGCNERVVEGTPAGCLAMFLSVGAPCVRVPVGVEDGSSVPAEERDLVGRTAFFVDGDNGEGATTARLPVDCNVLGIGLWGVSALRRGRVRAS